MGLLLRSLHRYSGQQDHTPLTTPTSRRVTGLFKQRPDFCYKVSTEQLHLPNLINDQHLFERRHLCSVSRLTGTCTSCDHTPSCFVESGSSTEGLQVKCWQSHSFKWANVHMILPNTGRFLCSQGGVGWISSVKWHDCLIRSLLWQPPVCSGQRTPPSIQSHHVEPYPEATPPSPAPTPLLPDFLCVETSHGNPMSLLEELTHSANERCLPNTYIK